MPYSDHPSRASIEIALGTGADEAKAGARLAGVQRKSDGMMRAMEDGIDQPSMTMRLNEPEAEKATLLAHQRTPRSR